MSEWIEWKGGERPVPSDTQIEVRLRSGKTNSDPARRYVWYHDGAFSDIVAYRVVKSAPAADDHEALTFHDLATGDAPVKLSNPKDNIGDTKVPLWLLSPIAKAAWALAQFAGMLKYGAWNWRAAGVRTSVYISAMQRHIDAYVSGEEYDPVDGTHHLGNIMSCCAILLDAKAAGKLTDDRPPSVDLRPTYDAVQKQMAVLKDKYKDMAPRHYTIADTPAESDK